MKNSELKERLKTLRKMVSDRGRVIHKPTMLWMINDVFPEFKESGKE